MYRYVNLFFFSRFFTSILVESGMIYFFLVNIRHITTHYGYIAEIY